MDLAQVGNARTPKTTRLLEELNRELLEAKDRADARKFRVERLKRKIEVLFCARVSCAPERGRCSMRVSTLLLRC